MSTPRPRPATTDLCDAHGARVRVAEPLFQDYGARAAFAGRVTTVKVFEDNALVRAALEEPADGRVLVVDGGGSLRTALLGGKLAELAERNGWDGVLVYGCVRDRVEIARADVGVKALGACPRKSEKRGWGERDVPVRFAGIEIAPGQWIYADADGILVSDGELALPGA